jgi:hypothetical protein
MNKLHWLLLCASLASCATESSLLRTPEADRYRCENNIAFTVRFTGDSATINSNRGYEVLLRTAGGLNPSQTVYSNPRMRAEFSLDASGKGAILRYPLQPLVVRCVLD